LALDVRGTPTYSFYMVIIRFENEETEKRALGWLAGRFSFKTWANGDLMVQDRVLPFLAREGISFFVKGPASYEHFAPAVRSPHSIAV
jgi:hypothetical protein